MAAGPYGIDWNKIVEFSKQLHLVHQTLGTPARDNIGESARNRFGRPYISGRPLLACDRQRIIFMFQEGMRKIEIARALGVTHSCVSKVIRKFEETGMISLDKSSLTASCACPGESPFHDPSICRHLRYLPKDNSLNQPKDVPKKFSIDWILSDLKHVSHQDKPNPADSKLQ